METKEEFIDLKELFETIKKRLVLILAIALVAVVGVAIVNYYIIKPVYQAKAAILIKETNKGTINNQEIQANLNLINTYNEIIKSPRILDEVGKKLNYSEGQTAGLSGKITVSSVKNSQVISITVEADSQPTAALIANTVAETFEANIKSIMSIDNVRILTPAKTNPNAAPIRPNKGFNVAIALVVGLIVGGGLALLLEYLDNTIKTERDIEKVLELPILGAVPRIEESKANKKSRKLRPYEEVAATRERRA